MTTTDKRDPYWINTATGKRFNFLKPTADAIDIVDIAISLSQINRYAGHTRMPYCVAQHSLFVSQLVAARGGTINDQRWGLMHDAGEAYVTDVPWPLKSAGLVPGIIEAEKGVMAVLAPAFGLVGEEPEIVRNADLELLDIESEWLLVRHPDWHSPIKSSPELQKLFMSWSLRSRFSMPRPSAREFISRAINLGLATLGDENRLNAYYDLADESEPMSRLHEQ